MSDEYVEVGGKSWFGRLGRSFKGILVGLVLFLGSIALLFWNEGRAVKTAKGLSEGAAQVVSLPAPRVDRANEGALVHATGLADTQDVLTDDLFGVSDRAIKLVRRVEMYQWRETKSTKTEKKVGGGEKTETTYSYSKVWSASEISSESFKVRNGHENPPMRQVSKTLTAQKVTLGDFVLSPGLIGQMDKFTSINADPARRNDISYALGETVSPFQGGWYLGADPARPRIGDHKVVFLAVEPYTVSIISRQRGDSFEPFITSYDTEIDMLESGTHSADQMFTAAQEANKSLTWILRGVGFVLMFIGLKMILSPLSVLLDVLPFLGNIAGTGISLVSLLLAAVISLITAAAAWLFYRPLLGGIMLALAVGLIFVLRKMRKPAPAVGRAAPAAGPGVPPPPPPA